MISARLNNLRLKYTYIYIYVYICIYVEYIEYIKYIEMEGKKFLWKITKMIFSF